MEDIDPISIDPIEDKIAAEWAASDAGIFIMWYQRESTWRICDLPRLLSKFPHEAARTINIIGGDIIADPDEISFRTRR